MSCAAIGCCGPCLQPRYALPSGPPCRPPFRLERTASRCEGRRTFSCRAEGDGKVVERRAFGEVVLESTEPFPEPPEKDFWEGQKWDFIGKTAGFAVPVIVVLGVVVGFFAAGQYNNGATEVFQPPTSPEDTGRVVPALSALESPPLSEE